jgi:hypothetical protein
LLLQNQQLFFCFYDPEQDNILNVASDFVKTVLNLQGFYVKIFAGKILITHEGTNKYY